MLLGDASYLFLASSKDRQTSHPYERNCSKILYAFASGKELIATATTSNIPLEEENFTEKHNVKEMMGD